MSVNNSQTSLKLTGLDSPQAARMKNYSRNLRTDRELKLFDTHVEDLALKYAKRDISTVIKQADSVGFTRSKYEYYKIEEQIQRFEQPNHEYFGWNKNFRSAKKELIAAVSKYFLNPLVFNRKEDIMDNLPKKASHPGFDYITTGLRKKGDYAEEVMDLMHNAIASARTKGSFEYPCLIGTRTQGSVPYDREGNFTGQTKSKSRLVVMVAFGQIICELMYARPVQDTLSLLPWYAGGKDDYQISDRMRKMRTEYKHWLSIDYSGFDQSISSWLIHEAFDVVKAMFRPGTIDEQVWDAIVRDFCCKVFVDGYGNERKSVKGIPSGSMFTQIIGSIVNKLMIDTYLKSINHKTTYDMMVMGDDNIIFTSRKLDSKDLASYLRKNFGVELHHEKFDEGSWRDTPVFLSRDWLYNGPTRCWKHLVCMMMYPERFRDYRRDEMRPEYILYSYYLAYRKDMDYAFDMYRFFEDYPNIRKEVKHEGLKGVSGYFDFRFNYLKRKISKFIPIY